MHNEFTVIEKMVSRRDRLITHHQMKNVMLRMPLVIRGNSFLSQQYQNEFNRLWAESSPVQCSYS